MPDEQVTSSIDVLNRGFSDTGIKFTLKDIDDTVK